MSRFQTPDQPPASIQVAASIACSIVKPPCTGPLRPGLIFDRDGVLVVEVNYLHRIEDVRLEQGVPDLLREATRRGLPVAVATNQSGIDRGYFSWSAYEAVAARLDALLAEQGASLAGTAACPFHPRHTPGYGPGHDWWRKPGPGLLILLAERLNLALATSWMVGDKLSDLQAARAAGLAGAVHVLTGHGASERSIVEGWARETGYPMICVATPGDIAGKLAGMFASG